MLRRLAIFAALLLIAGALAFCYLTFRSGAHLIPGPRLTLRQAARARGLAWPLRKVRLVVDCERHWLIVFSGRARVQRYPVALSVRLGDKRRRGDWCTPRGRSYVCTKATYDLEHSTVGSHWMGLSYPDLVHARRGLRDKLITKAQYRAIAQALARRRIPPQGTPLGGGIGIHNCRSGLRHVGRGYHWTAGCVVMETDAISELYPHCTRRHVCRDPLRRSSCGSDCPWTHLSQTAL